MANGEVQISVKIKEMLEKNFKTKIKDNEITVLGQSEKGDNYLGDIYFVKIEGNINKDLVLKCGKTSKELRQSAPVKTTFENEIYIYDTVIKRFKDFQIGKGLNPFTHVPICYGHFNIGDFEMIVMENLNASGYKMHNRKITMDLAHMEIVLKAYAQWHALSIAFNDQNPKGFDELSSKLSNVWDAFEKANNINKMMQGNVKSGINIVKNDLTPENYKRLLKFADDNPLFMKPLMENGPHKPYFVISHGDCWNNNFVFKYENDVPTDVKILDWQMSKRISPAYDLAYFIICSISRNLLPSMENLLMVYYKALNEQVQKLGSNLGKILSYSDLLEDFREHSKIGLIFAFTLAKICTTDKEGAFDIADAADKGEDPFSGFLFVPKDTKPFKERLLPVLEYFLNENLI